LGGLEELLEDLCKDLRSKRRFEELGFAFVDVEIAVVHTTHHIIRTADTLLFLVFLIACLGACST
jgi:hypothetical protein